MLWFLLPLMAGYAAALRFPPPPAGNNVVLLVAGAAALAAGWAAATGRPAVWFAALPLAVGAASFVLVHLRHPLLHEWSDRPPTEVTLILEVDQAFPASPRARSLSGLGTVVEPPARFPELRGQRMYYSAVRRVSVSPLRSGQYRVQGVLEPLPRESVGFDAYLHNLGVRHRLVRGRAVEETAAVRPLPRFYAAAEERLESILRLGLSNRPEIASLYLAMLLGAKAVLSPEQENAFLRSGTFHVFSVSGLHVGVIAAALMLSLRTLRIPRPVEFLVTLTALWFYVQVTGASSPALRSFLMVAFLRSASLFRLPGNQFAALVASAIATLLLDPLQLFSTGFQMSYSVVAALILMGRPLSDAWLARWKPFALLPEINWTRRHRVARWIGQRVLQSVAVCSVAFLASMPAGIGYFGLLSVASLPANLLVVPLSGYVLTIGFGSMLAGLLGFAPLSILFNLAAMLLLDAIIGLLPWATGLPGAYFTAGYRAAWLAPCGLIWITGAIAAGAAGRWSPRYGGYWLPVAALLMLLLFGVTFD